LDEIGSLNVAIATRLHGGIAAYLTGVAAGLVTYHPKIEDFAQDVGYPKSLVIQPDAPVDRWRQLGDALAAKLQPTMPPAEYVGRADAAYLKG
jgi:polysaccharide pyruvyl transferase WcaK-like protein